MRYQNMGDRLTKLKVEVEQYLNNSDFDNAFCAVSTFVDSILHNPRATGKVFGSRDLDTICQMIWTSFYETYPLESSLPVVSDNNLTIYLATELYISGGHTAVIEDFIKYQPNRRHLIILTDLFNQGIKQEILDRFAVYSIDIMHAPISNYFEKALFIRSQLNSLPPCEVFLFNHHHDPVALCLPYKQLTNYKIYYYHHCDHNCTLGLFLPNVTHIDPHPFGFFNCKNSLNISDVSYLPLTVTNLPDSNDREFLKYGTLTTCSSGSLGKFTQKYAFNYFHEIPNILAVTRGKHIHIGYLTDNLLQEVYNSLRIKGIGENNFIYIPWVKSLSRAMIENDVDIYLNSFPLGGGKAVIEVMASGTPILNHLNYRTILFSGAGIIYPEAMTWEKPSDIYSLLQKTTKHDLLKHSSLAREHYIKYHTPEIFAKLLDALRIGQFTSPPTDCTEITYSGDKLRTFLEDEEELVNEISLMQRSKFRKMRNLWFRLKSLLSARLKY
jgi:hypothetical protein